MHSKKTTRAITSAIALVFPIEGFHLNNVESDAVWLIFLALVPCIIAFYFPKRESMQEDDFSRSFARFFSISFIVMLIITVLIFSTSQSSEAESIHNWQDDFELAKIAIPCFLLLAAYVGSKNYAELLIFLSNYVAVVVIFWTFMMSGIVVPNQ